MVDGFTLPAKYASRAIRLGVDGVKQTGLRFTNRSWRGTSESFNREIIAMTTLSAKMITQSISALLATIMFAVAPAIMQAQETCEDLAPEIARITERNHNTMLKIH